MKPNLFFETIKFAPYLASVTSVILLLSSILFLVREESCSHGTCLGLLLLPVALMLLLVQLFICIPIFVFRSKRMNKFYIKRHTLLWVTISIAPLLLVLYIDITNFKF